MTAFELLKSNENLLRILVDNSISIQDVTHLQIYEEFVKMKKEGHKVCYIAVHLGGKYGLSERGVYKVVKRLSRDVKLLG